ncbi:GNAT family N-acetyltransferase [Gluconacetobacter asukensis]|uniref:GNAT family N-acetyltransferase n=1 Tax=Gluconacetobacter asukensis TaxID=1017181 RepID=A0A7W4IYB0_9PROT|nr:GNAT family N-acetyltransferase [Gluconacetobacter asukensis]MBB2171098.1 GNAT family N-acetyltransferase [Gluconacetobacter asukensis]
MTDTTIRITDQPTAEECAAVLNTLRRFTRATVPVLDNQDFAALVSMDGDTIVGGLIASSRWGGFHIEMLALPDIMRGKGLGSHLLTLAEEEARRRACHHMWLDTQAFQARQFYERHGFAVFGQIDGPAPYYPRYFMQKVLA